MAGIELEINCMIMMLSTSSNLRSTLQEMSNVELIYPFKHASLTQSIISMVDQTASSSRAHQAVPGFLNLCYQTPGVSEAFGSLLCQLVGRSRQHLSAQAILILVKSPSQTLVGWRSNSRQTLSCNISKSSRRAV